MPLSEFEIIDRFFRAGAPVRDDVLIDIGDDAALVSVAADRAAAPRTGAVALAGVTIAEGTQLRAGADARRAGRWGAVLALNALAARGARPAWLVLSITLPDADPDWVAGFAGGIAAVTSAAGVALVGGDTTRGPRSATLIAHGPAVGDGDAADPAPGDLLFVTGPLGAAIAAGLVPTGDGESARGAGPRAGSDPRRPGPAPLEPTLHDAATLRGCRAAPLARGLRAAAAALLEITGVSGDAGAGRIAGIAISRPRLPLHAGCDARHGDPLALAGDWEVAFLAPPARPPVPGAFAVGVVEAGPGVRLCDDVPDRLAASARAAPR